MAKLSAEPIASNTESKNVSQILASQDSTMFQNLTCVLGKSVDVLVVCRTLVLIALNSTLKVARAAKSDTSLSTVNVKSSSVNVPVVLPPEVPIAQPRVPINVPFATPDTKRTATNVFIKNVLVKAVFELSESNAKLTILHSAFHATKASLVQ